MFRVTLDAKQWDLTSFIKAYDVRGLVPEELSPEVVTAIGSAFAEVVAMSDYADTLVAAPMGELPQPTIVIGHDMRPSSPELVDAFAAGVTRRGVNVIRIGLCSTDGLYFASGFLKLPGAMFTASHNPAQYNGIKMCRAGAKPVGEQSGLAEIRDLATKYLNEGLPAASTTPGTVTDREMLGEYASYLRSLVDLSGIRPLKVVIDAGNGMGGYTVPSVLGTDGGLDALPLEIIPMYFELDGTFPNHEANPLDPKNIVDLQRAVLEHGADIGLAFDGDADRCFVVDERGQGVTPSAITAMVGLREIAREKAEGRDATVIYNLISSQIVPELITAAGAESVRTRVGHSFIKAQMAEHNAVFGGEHSGHFYFRDFFFADTGMLAAMHVLATLGSQGLPLSDLADQFQPYVPSGEINSRVSDVVAARERVREAFSTEPDVTFDDLDGMTVTHWSSTPRWWFNLRPSNTEPLLRLNVEAADEDVMEKIRDAVLAIVRSDGGSAA